MNIEKTSRIKVKESKTENTKKSYFSIKNLTELEAKTIILALSQYENKVTGEAMNELEKSMNEKDTFIHKNEYYFKMQDVRMSKGIRTELVKTAYKI